VKTALVRAAVGTAAICFAFCLTTRADELPNGPRAAKSGPVLEDRKRARLVVEPRDYDREIVLVLPRAMNPETAAGRASLTPLQTTVSGVALSLAIVGGGLWLARSRRGPRVRAAVAGRAAVAAVAGAAGYALGNATPYPEGDADPGALRSLYPDGITISGQVRVLYQSDDGAVHLIVPKRYINDH
jgi:hypothetical protein